MNTPRNHPMQFATVTVEPTLRVATIDELKTQLRLAGDDGSHDGLLSTLLRTAEQMVEDHTHRKLLDQTVVVTRDGWPTGREPTIRLIPPAREVTSIAYRDADGADQTLDLADVRIDTAAVPTRITLKAGKSWPTTDGDPACVSVTYQAGASTAAEVQPNLKIAVLMLAHHLYEHPSATADRQLHEVPLAVGRILDPLRIPLL